MLEVLVIEQNDFWMEKVSTLGLDCGFYGVLVRVVDGNCIPDHPFFWRGHNLCAIKGWGRQ